MSLNHVIYTTHSITERIALCIYDYQQVLPTHTHTHTPDRISRSKYRPQPIIPVAHPDFNSGASGRTQPVAVRAEDQSIDGLPTVECAQVLPFIHSGPIAWHDHPGEREGGREGGREGWRERGWEGERKGAMKRGELLLFNLWATSFLH